MLERNDEALASSNGVLVTDNTLFHDKIRQMTRQVEEVAHQVERLQQQATQVGNDVMKYREQLDATTTFIRNIADLN